MEDSKKEITMKVACRIKHFRQLRGLSQEALALSSGINTAYFGHVERGLKCPTVDTLNKISGALNITLAELLSFEEVSTVENFETIEKIYFLVRALPAERACKIANIVQEIVMLSQDA